MSGLKFTTMYCQVDELRAIDSKVQPADGVTSAGILGYVRFFFLMSEARYRCFQLRRAAYDYLYNVYSELVYNNVLHWYRSHVLNSASSNIDNFLTI